MHADEKSQRQEGGRIGEERREEGNILESLADHQTLCGTAANE